MRDDDVLEIKQGFADTLHRARSPDDYNVQIIPKHSLVISPIERILGEEIASTFSEDYLNSFIDGYFQRLLTGHATLTDAFIKEMVTTLLSIDIEEWEVVKPLFGMEARIRKPINLGRYRIYRIPHDIRHMKCESTLVMAIREEMRSWPKVPKLAVGVRASARDAMRASEIVQADMDVFLELLSCVTGFSITGPPGRKFLPRQTNEYYIAMSTHSGVAGGFGEWDDIYFPLSRDEIESGRKVFPGIWEIASKSQRKEMEGRVLRAAVWVGRARMEPVLEKKFIMFMFSMEALLSYAEPISPSVADQVSETAAYLLEPEGNERLEQYRRLKKLYRKRNDVVHGREAKIDFYETYGVENTALRLISAVLKRKDIMDIGEQSALVKYFRELRFGIRD